MTTNNSCITYSIKCKGYVCVITDLNAYILLQFMYHSKTDVLPDQSSPHQCKTAGPIPWGHSPKSILMSCSIHYPTQKKVEKHRTNLRD